MKGQSDIADTERRNKSWRIIKINEREGNEGRYRNNGDEDRKTGRQVERKRSRERGGTW